MFDDIMADEQGNAVGSVSGKDKRGVKYAVKLAVAPGGDLFDDDDWDDAAEAGGSISESGKGKNGETRQRTIKEAKVSNVQKGLKKLFGTYVPPARKPREPRGAKADTLEPSKNGEHTEETEAN